MKTSDLHRTRIANDYKDMLTIQKTSMVSWVATKGTPPYVEEYLLTVHIRTYCSPTETIDREVIRLSLPDQYPLVAPLAVMDEKLSDGKLIYHPNWYPGGKWCCGKYPPSEKLINYVTRMLMSLQYDETLINPKSPANIPAKNWYLTHKGDPKYYPSDKSPLPTITAKPHFKRLR